MNMKGVILFLRRFLGNKKKRSRGQAAIEYVLLTALVVIMMNVVFSNVRFTFYQFIVCFTEKRVAPGCPGCLPENPAESVCERLRHR